MEPWMMIVLLGLVVVVYAQIGVQAKRHAAKAKAPYSADEVAKAMERFSAELEEDNQQLVERLAQMKQAHDEEIRSLRQQVVSLEQRQAEIVRQLEQMQEEAAHPVRSSQQAGSSGHGRQTGGTDAAEQERAAVTLLPIRERYTELFQLYEQGKSTEYIAKALNKNKGEVMLIMQLARQEEQSRAK